MKRPQGISIFGIIALVLILFAIGIVLLAAIGQVFGGVFLSKPCIAQIKIESEITDVSPPVSMFTPEPPPSAKDIIKMIDSANSRSDVKAIVLYVDSPGGEVIPSREIYEHVKNSKKPVVAYFRSMATSGGYYAAVGSDYIVAEPETITGSIGVRTTTVSLAGLFGKLGINYTDVTSGELKSIGDVGHNLTDKERAVLQSIINEIFFQFRDTVYENRYTRPRFNKEKFEEVLDGRIITGRQAYDIGLVDELGNETRAFNKAAELAGIKEYDKCEMSPQRGILRSFMEEVAWPLQVYINFNTLIVPNRAVSMSYT